MLPNQYAVNHSDQPKENLEQVTEHVSLPTSIVSSINDHNTS